MDDQLVPASSEMDSDRLRIPDDAIKYILFQRTGYLRSPITLLDRYILRRLPFHIPLYHLVVPIEAHLGASRIKSLYEADMSKEYGTIRSFLPAHCTAVLDIGCGVAGIDVLLNRHYSGYSPDFYLLDKSHVEPAVYYLFNQQGAFYNSLDVAMRLLSTNDVPAQRIHLLEANDSNPIRINGKIDLALSLLSWGFHYPVNTYATEVYQVLSEHGVVILDIRKGTDGIEVLKHKFSQVDVILETGKQYRVAARK